MHIIVLKQEGPWLQSHLMLLDFAFFLSLFRFLPFCFFVPFFFNLFSCFSLFFLFIFPQFVLPPSFIPFKWLVTGSLPIFSLKTSLTFFFKTSYMQPSPTTPTSISPLSQQTQQQFQQQLGSMQSHAEQQLQQFGQQQQASLQQQRPFVSRFRKPPLGEPVVALEDPEYQQSIVSERKNAWNARIPKQISQRNA